MKKIFSLLAVALIAASVSARDLNTASWDFTANDAALGLKVLGEGTGGVFDTLTVNGIQYAIRFVHPKSGAGATTAGLYCHNSNSSKGDNYLEIYVPGGVKGKLAITFATGSKSQSYNFFANIKDAADTVPATMYDTAAVASTNIQSFTTSKSTSVDLDTLTLDFLTDTATKVIRVFHVSTTGGRFKTVSFIETEVAEETPTDPTALTDEKQPAVAVKKMVNGQMVIYRDGKEYNILGAEL